MGCKNVHSSEYAFIQNELINVIAKSICKITYKIGKINKYGTGFFMNISNDNSFKSLITNYHVISEDLINKYIELELHNKETKKLFLDNNFRKIIFFKYNLDITVIEIKNDDLEIIKNVIFLDFDYNYLRGYNQYKDIFVFASGYPYGKKIVIF